MADNRKRFWRVAGAVAFLALSGVISSGCVIDAATTVVEERQFGNVLSDTEIKADIIKRLLDPKHNDLFFNVSSDVYEGRVMLTGSVKTESDRKRATGLIQGLSGVKTVYNEIQVTDQGGFRSTANDVWINAKLNTKYFAEVGVKSINLRWRVINGAVYLLGLARSEKERRLMIALAKDTKHVIKVTDHIAVK